MLGLAGADSGAETIIDTDSVTQVLDIAPVARRSLALPGTDGIFYCYFENVHGAADDESSTIDPYAPGDAAVAPYPGTVPRDLDFWVLQCSGRRTAGAGGLTSAAFVVVPSGTGIQQGWGIDDLGAAVTSVFVTVAARFDTIENVGGLFAFATEEGNTVVHINRRIPRGSNLSFHSTSGGAAEFQMILTCALLPLGLGQDVSF